MKVGWGSSVTRELLIEDLVCCASVYNLSPTYVLKWAILKCRPTWPKKNLRKWGDILKALPQFSSTVTADLLGYYSFKAGSKYGGASRASVWGEEHEREMRWDHLPICVFMRYSEARREKSSQPFHLPGKQQQLRKDTSSSSSQRGVSYTHDSYCSFSSQASAQWSKQTCSKQSIHSKQLMLFSYWWPLTCHLLLGQEYGLSRNAALTHGPTDAIETRHTLLNYCIILHANKQTNKQKSIMLLKSTRLN